MNSFIVLLAGDQKRLRRYGISWASLAVSLLWIVFIQLLDLQNLSQFFGLFVMADATLMSFLLVGVSMIYEKQEHALKTLLVSPISATGYLGSKIASTIVSALTSLVILLVYGMIFRGLNSNIVLALVAVVLGSGVFACFGILFTYIAKDFTTLLMYLMGFALVMVVPSMVQFFAITDATWLRYVQYLNPNAAVLTLLQAANNPFDTQDLVVSLVYLTVLFVGLFAFAVKKFAAYRNKEFGGE